MIKKGDNLYVAGMKALEAMHEFWDVKNQQGEGAAVQWLEDTSGRVLIFTRGEYRDAIMRSVQDRDPGIPAREIRYFERHDFEHENWPEED